MKKNLIILIPILLALIAPPFLPLAKAQPGIGCGYPPVIETLPIGKRNTWKPNTTIKVYIGGGFTADQVTAIKAAFQSFTDKKTINQSGVSFDADVASRPSNVTTDYCEVKAEMPITDDDQNASGRGGISPVSGAV